MTCEDLLAALNEVIDDASALDLYHEFAEHLTGCHPCQLVVDNIRKTIRLYKDGEPYPVPPACAARMRDALREKWKAVYPQSTG